MSVERKRQVVNMNASQRRIEILSLLEKQMNPITARNLADTFQVSRQIIVGDIALLRAEGNDILSTPRGYLYGNKENIETGFTVKLVCQHTEEQARMELQLIVDNGGEIVDVEVEHPIYGLLSGILRIRTSHDVDEFIRDVKENRTKMLSSLTDGVHIHTIKCKDKESFEQIQNQLREAGILYS